MTSEEFSTGALGSHHAPSGDDLYRLSETAAGKLPADLLIRNAKVLALHSKEILERDILISGAFIAAIVPAGSDCTAKKEVDVGGRFVAPAFIDTHLHIEYTMLTPGEFARCVVPRGTGTVLADPNCIGNALGAKAMDWAGQTKTPLKIFQQISSRIPRNPEVELGGAVVTEDEQLTRMIKTNAVTVGESTPFGIDQRATRLYSKAITEGRRVTGHTARVSGSVLNAYAATGVGDDHNAFETEEVLERIRLGMMITVMSGSMNDNVASVFADIDKIKHSFPFFSFCADDRHVDDLHRVGHIDHHIREAIKNGVPVLEAYAMASLNAALYYRLDHIIGSITPARRADFVVLDSLEDVAIHSTYMDGVCVAKDGAALFPNTDPVPDYLYHSFNISEDFCAQDFRIAVNEAAANFATVKAMEMYDGYFKRGFEAELSVENADVLADPLQDIAKIFVVDRYHGGKTKAGGFVKGFNLHSGAIASSTNCENQNLVVLGTNNRDMAVAANAIKKLGGGYVAVNAGEVIAALPLPLAGIMSDKPWEEVLLESDKVDAAAHALGSQLPSPFMILAFVGLAGVPDYGLTEKGLIDAPTQQFIPVVVCCRCPQHIHELPEVK